jgi:hypothetical protein
LPPCPFAPASQYGICLISQGFLATLHVFDRPIVACLSSFLSPVEYSTVSCSHCLFGRYNACCYQTWHEFGIRYSLLLSVADSVAVESAAEAASGSTLGGAR